MEEANVQLTTLTELPPPSPGRSDMAQRGIAAFSAYATQQMQQDGGTERREALLAEPGSLDPTRRDCGLRKPAVLIDLDPGRGTFDPLDEATPASSLPEALATLREEGIAVAWQSRLGSHFETAARDRLRAAAIRSTCTITTPPEFFAAIAWARLSSTSASRSIEILPISSAVVPRSSATSMGMAL